MLQSTGITASVCKPLEGRQRCYIFCLILFVSCRLFGNISCSFAKCIYSYFSSALFPCSAQTTSRFCGDPAFLFLSLLPLYLCWIRVYVRKILTWLRTDRGFFHPTSHIVFHHFENRPLCFFPGHLYM